MNKNTLTTFIQDMATRSANPHVNLIGGKPEEMLHNSKEATSVSRPISTEICLAQFA